MAVVELPPSCKEESGRLRPIIDTRRCEAKGDCLEVCPYDVFEIRKLTAEEKGRLGVLTRLKVFAHGNKQAFVVKPESCHACGLCVRACPEKAIKLQKIT